MWTQVSGPAHVGDIVSTPQLWGRYEVTGWRADDNGSTLAQLRADDFTTFVPADSLYNIRRKV